MDVLSDKEALRIYQMREMGLSDWTSGLNHARREGMKEGLRIGREQVIREAMEKGMREGIEESRREIAAK
ncbi:MAG: hypothetical protein LBP81_04405, partial [Treponema sp.]|nr:hypothetical protein [Treponema sp.]